LFSAEKLEKLLVTRPGRSLKRELWKTGILRNSKESGLLFLRGRLMLFSKTSKLFENFLIFEKEFCCDSLSNQESGSFPQHTTDNQGHIFFPRFSNGHHFYFLSSSAPGSVCAAPIQMRNFGVNLV